MDYITAEDNKWMVCIGVPYATHLWQVANSSEFNGAFKIGLTKAKKRYLKFKPIAKKRFCLSDIIPLVNHAWGKSFGRADVAKKAVANRGWGPLNYVLLDSPKLIQLDKGMKRKLVALNPELLENVNLDGDVAGGYIAMIFDDQLKTEGVKKRMVEQKRKSDANENKYEVLQDAANWTSGKFCGEGLFNMSRPEVVKCARIHFANKKVLTDEKEVRAVERKSNLDNRMKEAIRRFKTVPST